MLITINTDENGHEYAFNARNLGHGEFQEILSCITCEDEGRIDATLHELVSYGHGDVTAFCTVCEATTEFNLNELGL